MPRPEKRIQNLNPQEISDLFLDECSCDSTSGNSRDFLDAILKKFESGRFPDDQAERAQELIPILTGLFSTTPSQRFDRPPNGDLKPSPPSGIAWNAEGELILADDFNHRLQIFDTELKLKKQFGAKGKGHGEFQYPKGIALDSAGNIFVTDSWNHRIQKFDGEGNFISTFGEFGEGPGQMNEPWDICIEPSGLITVVERYNHRLQFFDPQGRSLGWMGARGTVLEDQLAFIYGTAESNFPRPVFEFPTGIARDSLGHFYISDSANHRIVKFDGDWNQLLSFGQQGNGPGEFQYAMHVTVDSNDQVYVADLNNDRIQRFTSEGIFIEAFSQGAGEDSIKMPTLLGMDPANQLWVGLTLDPALHAFKNNNGTGVETYQRLTELQPDKAILHFAFGIHLSNKGENDKAEIIFENGAETWDPAETPEEDPEPWEAGLEALISSIAWDRGSADESSSLPQWRQNVLERLSYNHARYQEKLLEFYREWNEFYPTLIARRVEEQNRVIEKRDDPVAFDREFHELKSRDRDFFYRTRQGLDRYRNSVLRMEDWAQCLLACRLKEGELSPLLENQRDNFMRTGETIRNLLKQKERNETALVQVLQQENGVQENWAEFVALYGINGKIQELVRQLIVELEAIIRTMLTAANRFPEKPCVSKVLNDLGGNGPGSLLFCQLLMGFQEDIDLYRHLQGVFKNLLDTAVLLPHIPSTEKVLPPDFFQPVPFDTEVLTSEDLLGSYRVGGTPVELDQGVQVGGEKVSAPHLGGNEAEVGRHMLSILDNHAQFNPKFSDLFEQVRQLRNQKSDLEDKLLKLDVRDRVTPIQIGNNVLVVDFQTSLLNRMILTLEINETQNLTRLLTGTALLSTLSESSSIPEFKVMSERIRNLKKQEGEQLEALKRQWREAGLADARLHAQSNAPSSQFDADEIAQREKLKRELADSGFNCMKTASDVFRSARTFNLLKRMEPLLEDPGPNPSQLTFEKTVGCFGPGRPDFLFPFGICHDTSGNLYVSDSNRHCILKFSSSGVFLKSFGKFGNGPGGLCKPYGICMGPDKRVYVADHGNRRIQVFNSDGRFISTLGTNGPEEEHLSPFFNLDVDQNNRVWVPDTDRHRVLVFDPEGACLKIFGGGGTGPENLWQPVSICCLDDGGYVVGDRSEFSLKRFDAEGNHVASFMGGTDALGEPYGIAYHPDYGLLVSDTYHCQIICLDLSLQPVWVHNQTGRRGGQHLRLGGLSIYEGCLFTADYDNLRVQRLSLP